jgi:hypothetical protein
LGGSTCGDGSTRRTEIFEDGIECGLASEVDHAGVEGIVLGAAPPLAIDENISEQKSSVSSDPFERNLACIKNFDHGRPSDAKQVGGLLGG